MKSGVKSMFPCYELRSAAMYVCPQKKVNIYPARFHKQVELLWARERDVEVSIDGVVYTLHKGDIYVCFPNILHSINKPSKNVLLIVADDDFFAPYHDVLSHSKPKNPIVRSGEFPEIVYTLLERTEELRKISFYQKGNALSGYISAILGELINCMELVDRSADTDLIQQLILYMLDNYTHEITLDDVARELNYSKYYISHIISQTFNCNFRVLINSYRISLTQNLLLSTNKTVSEIAFECGFKNQSSFNRIFMKHCGVTPSDFRKIPEEIPEKPTIYEKMIDNKTQQCYNFPVGKGN